MRKLALCACVAAMFAAPCFARSDDAAAQVTCKDGTTQTVEHMRGACSHHGGVDKRETSESHAAAKNAEKDGATLDADRGDRTSRTRSMGAGAEKVWANENSKVYHCPGDRFYGKTKRGEYMSEAEAKDKGFRPDHGKACKS